MPRSKTWNFLIAGFETRGLSTPPLLFPPLWRNNYLLMTGPLCSYDRRLQFCTMQAARFTDSKHGTPFSRLTILLLPAPFTTLDTRGITASAREQIRRKRRWSSSIIVADSHFSRRKQRGMKKRWWKIGGDKGCCNVNNEREGRDRERRYGRTSNLPLSPFTGSIFAHTHTRNVHVLHASRDIVHRYFPRLNPVIR